MKNFLAFVINNDVQRSNICLCITMDEWAYIGVKIPNADERLYRQTAALNNEVLMSTTMQSTVVSYSHYQTFFNTIQYHNAMGKQNAVCITK